MSNQQEAVNADSKLDAISFRGAGRRRQRLVLAGIITGAACLYFLAYDPSRFGSSHDDGIYVATAKAMATGRGYRIISLPYEPSATKYPPLYPFLLSLIWRANSNFPHNVNAMVALTALAAVIFLWLTWVYLVRQRDVARWQALVIVAVVALNWRTVILATSLYTEMVYAALSVTALILAEKIESDSPDRLAGLALGLLIGLAIVTRSSGVALLGAVAIFFFLSRKIRRAWMPLVIGALFLAVWVGWSYANRPTAKGINVAYYTSYFGHLKEVVLDLTAQNHTSVPVTIVGSLATNAFMLIVISVPLVCFGLNFNWGLYLAFGFLLVIAGFVRDVSHGWRLIHVYVLGYLALHLLWLPFVSYDRFVMPILPFLLLFLFREFEAMASLARGVVAPNPFTRKASALIVGLVLLGAISIGTFNYASSLFRLLASAPLDKTVRPSPENLESIQWILTNTEDSDVLVCDRDPTYYLYTGRKTVHFLPMSPAIDWHNDPQPVFDILKQNDGKYLVLTESDFEFKFLKDLAEARPDQFVPVFISTNGRGAVYRITGAASTSDHARIHITH